MENTRPSWNDLVNTTLGGMALAEMEHRLSTCFSTTPRRAPSDSGASSAA